VPSIIARRLDSQWDPQRGQSLDNFIVDIEAVAQIIATRLKLLQGEWFENLAEGTPVFQSLLGVSSTMRGVALILQQVILGVPYVTGIANIQVNYQPNGRLLAFSATVETRFGSIAISSQPFPGAQASIASPSS